MNERIKELYLQAVEYSNGQMTFGDTREFFAEKFAELIVRECADKIERDYKYERGEDTKWITAFGIACDLKQHFGVE